MTFKERPGYYFRKRDGLRVVAADWPDGDVSWRLDPIPLIRAEIVGTCRAETFAANHVAQADMPAFGSSDS